MGLYKLNCYASVSVHYCLTALKSITFQPTQQLAGCGLIMPCFLTVASFGPAGCLAGYGFDGVDGCNICPVGTFSTGGMKAVCTPCKPNETSPPGAKTASACACAPGRREQLTACT
jgi:hypothetical protein